MNYEQAEHLINMLSLFSGPSRIKRLVDTYEEACKYLKHVTTMLEQSKRNFPFTRFTYRDYDLLLYAEKRKKELYYAEHKNLC